MGDALSRYERALHERSHYYLTAAATAEPEGEEASWCGRSDSDTLV